MKNLVIVESPTKAKTISKMLGSNYKVLASVGHVRDLPKSKMGIDIENNFEPQYINIRGKGDLIKELKSYAKKADTVYLATDPDREGEAIAWHLQYVLQKECNNFERVEFNAITKDVVKSAIKNSRAINKDMVDAQQARRIIDRIVGYSISPILWRKITKGLSAGRVQSVATKIICDREEEIKKFIPEEYWSIDAKFKYEDSLIEAQLISDIDGNKIKLNNKLDADEVLSNINKPFIVNKIIKKQKSRSSYLPFTTSSLQQEAANKLGFSTKKTMMIAQQLYEGISLKNTTVGLITYMRTDSIRINNDALEKLNNFIINNYGKDYLNTEKKVLKDSKNVQDAHEAIRPSDVNYIPDDIKEYLTNDQFKLYELIWKRFVASQMSSAKYEITTIDIHSDNKYIFRANGSIIKFIGFLKVYDYAEKEENILPSIDEDDELIKSSIKANQHFTKAPSRYTEASLVKTMEELGIGRPSTYAPTIATILSRGYVGKEKKQLYPTELGFLVNDIMKKYFSNIVNVDFTAELEQNLDKIANDSLKWKKLVSEFYGDFEKLLLSADEEIEKVELKEEISDEVCENCNLNMIVRTGKFGKFLACTNYPNCENTKPILNKIGIKCPLCKSGDVIERKTKKLKSFYGCSNFPNCNFISWNKPTNKKCPQCNEILYEHITKKVDELICQQEKCKYKENKE